eukprot:EG_transcript_27960
MSHSPEQKVTLIFQKFDVDKDGFWSFDETNAWQQATEGWQMPRDSFEEICEIVGADPAKGYSLAHVKALYMDRSLPSEVQLDLAEDWQKLFAAPAGKKGIMLL